jgi:hypothetical protein
LGVGSWELGFDWGFNVFITFARVDGQLDEALYTSATPISDFIQAEPAAGQPATERTEVWISFDRDSVYVSLRAFESQPSVTFG